MSETNQASLPMTQAIKTMTNQQKRIRRLEEAAKQVCDLPIESDFCTIRETVMNLQNVLNESQRS